MSLQARQYVSLHSDGSVSLQAHKGSKGEAWVEIGQFPVNTTLWLTREEYLRLAVVCSEAARLLENEAVGCDAPTACEVEEALSADAPPSLDERDAVMPQS